MGRRIPFDYVPAGSRLTYIKRTIISDFHNGIRGKALYQCICGNRIETDPSRVKNGTCISCGCYHKERTKASNTRHGLRRHPLHYIWKGIKARCLNLRSPAYKYYGAKGITICDEWKNNFLAFYEWAISNGWKEGAQIDKDIIPKRLGVAATEYSPKFCTIATTMQNSNARINYNHPLEFQGITQNIAEWARQIGVSTHVIQSRIKLGWAVDKILTTPVNSELKRKLTDAIRIRIINLHKNGKTQKQIADLVNVDQSTVCRFLNKKNKYGT